MRYKYALLQALLVAVALCVFLPSMAFASTTTAKQPLVQQKSQSVAHTRHAQEIGVYVWATDVFVHTCRSQYCGRVDQISTDTVIDFCQAQGDVVNAEGYTNNWWSYIETPGGIRGWISNIYIRGNAVIAGVPFC